VPTATTVNCLDESRHPYRWGGSWSPGLGAVAAARRWTLRAVGSSLSPTSLIIRQAGPSRGLRRRVPDVQCSICFYGEDDLTSRRRRPAAERSRRPAVGDMGCALWTAVSTLRLECTCPPPHPQSPPPPPPPPPPPLPPWYPPVAHLPFLGPQPWWLETAACSASGGVKTLGGTIAHGRMADGKTRGPPAAKWCLSGRNAPIDGADPGGGALPAKTIHT